MTTQVDQNRKDDDGRISQDTATPTAGTNQADTLGLGGGWNWRLFHTKRHHHAIGEYDHFWVGEAYYDKDGKLNGWSESYDSILSGDDANDVKETYTMLAEAFEKPILEVEDDVTDLVATDQEASND